MRETVDLYCSNAAIYPSLHHSSPRGGRSWNRLCCMRCFENREHLIGCSVAPIVDVGTVDSTFAHIFGHCSDSVLLVRCSPNVPRISTLLTANLCFIPLSASGGNIAGMALWNDCDSPRSRHYRAGVSRSPRAGLAAPPPLVVQDLGCSDWPVLLPCDRGCRRRTRRHLRALCLSLPRALPANRALPASAAVISPDLPSPFLAARALISALS